MTTNPMSDAAADERWQIQRYLLDDPEFDKESFEQRMLADPDLAWRVGDEQLSLEAVARAVCAVEYNAVELPSDPATVQQPTMQRQNMGRTLDASALAWMVAMAAGLIFALVTLPLWQPGERELSDGSQSVVSEAVEQGLSSTDAQGLVELDVLNQWLEMGGEESLRESDLLAGNVLGVSENENADSDYGLVNLGEMLGPMDAESSFAITPDVFADESLSDRELLVDQDDWMLAVAEFYAAEKGI